MANDNLQEQSVDAQDIPESISEGTNTEQKAPDQTLGTMTGSAKVVSHDVQAALDRLQVLEKAYMELTSLVHIHMTRDTDGGQKEPEPKTEETQNEPKCEIARISNAEWRARQFEHNYVTPDSLLTVAPKEREDRSSSNHFVEVQSGPSHGSGKPTAEASAIPTLRGKETSKKPYRAILNGRAELMEVLGGLFDAQSAPGFYFWFWPFKYLIVHEEKLRARLSEEESKLRDVDHEPKSEASLPMSDGAEIATQIDESSPKVQEAYVSQAHSDSVKDLKSEHRHRERMASQGPVQFEQVATESVHKAIHHERKADSSPPEEEPGEIKVESTFQTQEVDTERVDDTRLRDELRCLVTFMDTDLKDIYSVQKDIDKGTRKLIEFDHLWQLFKPGVVVISGNSQKRAYVVLHVTGGCALQRDAQHAIAKDGVLRREHEESYYAKYPKTSPFVIDCFYIDFDGTKFGPLPQKFMLEEYDGEVQINSLEVFPIRFDDDPKKTEKSLARRGRKFVKLANVEHKYYSGRTIREAPVEDRGEVVAGEVHGEIIVDFALAIKHFSHREYGSVQFGTGVIANPTLPDERETEGYYAIQSSPYKQTMFLDDDGYDNDLRADFIERTSLLKERSHSEKLPSEAWILLPPRVYGFSLLDRKWFAFDISLVEDIKYSNLSFDRLVIPEDHKKVMQALVQHHTKGPRIAAAEIKEPDQEFSMDIIRGKGKGLIILLHGVPGVGKTSTAECVAAQTGRPLFPITCGDIGASAGTVEFRLNNYFDMAHKWGCVLLLDEADVFLARREKGGDLERNGIVSVFLRVLEYYSGILILTTNRIGEFDEAFSSRVHIKLYYPKLDRKSTLEIWKMNIRRVAESEELGVDVNEDEIKKFARRQWADSAENPTQRWNGRQIRNAFQSAIALAKWDHQGSGEDTDTRPCLSVKQFEVVAKTSAHFDAYITKMHGIDEGDTWETIAARDHLRMNETPRRPTSRLLPASARTQAARPSAAKADTFEDDEEGDETDTDENEKEMRKLEEKLKKMKQKKQGPLDKKTKDTRAKSSRKPLTPEVEPGDSSDSSKND